MGGKSKSAPVKKSDDEKAAEKAAKMLAKAQAELLKAAKQGERSKVEAAFAAGVDIDFANEKGQTAAHYAAAFGHKKLLHYLFSNGADFTLRTTDHNKFTPLAAAQFIGETEAAAFIEALLAGTVATDVADGSDDDDDDDDDGEAGGATVSGQLVSASSKTRRRRPGASGVSDVATPSATTDSPPATQSATTTHVDTSALVVERTEEIERSASDARRYRFIRLANGLGAMLVSDPTCDYAAAAMDVGVGSAHDPIERPGLAHFCEHMCFLGTTKYPREDEYTAYVEQHGGETNAFTAHEDTHYFFDVGHAALPGALDRFAQFFIGPTFSAGATERELRAVDAEFAKNVHADAWRLQMLGKIAADPRHPWARFNAGNMATLADAPAPSCTGASTGASTANGEGVALELTPASSTRVELTLRPRAPAPRETLRDALLRFHEEMYSAERMYLAVLGRGSLDELEQLVAPLFAAVPCRPPPPPPDGTDGANRGGGGGGRVLPMDGPPRAMPGGPSVPPYPEARLGRKYRVVPSSSEQPMMTLTWPLPSIRHQYKSKPFRYVSHVLGHEGSGSLLALLKHKGWADSLMAGETQSHSDFATFVVTIMLTAAGSAHVDEVPPLVFAAIQLLAGAAPLPEWVYAEIGGVSRMRLRFSDTVEPHEAVLHISQALGQGVPPTDALTSSFQYDEWDPAAIRALLALLTPRRALLVHLAAEHAAHAPHTEPYYGTRYAVDDLDAALLAACEQPPAVDALKWPEPNPFIPTDFALLADGASSTPEAPPPPSAAAPAPTAAPVKTNDDGDGGGDGRATFVAALAARGPLPPPSLLRDTPLCEVWHRLDRTFRTPKTNLYLDVICPGAYASAEQAILTACCLRLVTDELCEFAYHAEVAGLTYSVRRHATGFYVTAEGYSHKLPLLVGRMAERLGQPALAEGRVADQLEAEATAVRAWFKSAPREHAKYAAAHLLEQRRWHVTEYVEVLDAACAEDVGRTCQRLRATHAALTRALRVTALCHGNTDAATTLDLVARAASALGGAALDAADAPDPRCLMLPSDVEVVLRSHASLYAPSHAALLHADETNAAVEVTLQAQLDASPSSQMVELLACVLSNPAFETLRTQEQLGYLVDLSVRYDHGVFGLRVTIQSDRHDPTYLDERVEAFFATVPALLAGLSPAALADHRDSLVRRRLAPPRTLRDESGHHWSEITNGTYCFERDALAAEAAAALTPADLAQYWAAHFDAAAPGRRKLSSQAYAPRHALPPKRAHGVGGRRVVYVDGLSAAQAFKATLPAFAAAPKRPKPPLVVA